MCMCVSSISLSPPSIVHSPPVVLSLLALCGQRRIGASQFHTPSSMSPSFCPPHPFLPIISLWSDDRSVTALKLISVQWAQHFDGLLKSQRLAVSVHFLICIHAFQKTPQEHKVHAEPLLSRLFAITIVHCFLKYDLLLHL